MPAQQRLGLAWASVQSVEASVGPVWLAKGQKVFHTECKDLSDCIDAQADLSL